MELLHAQGRQHLQGLKAAEERAEKNQQAVQNKAKEDESATCSHAKFD